MGIISVSDQTKQNLSPISPFKFPERRHRGFKMTAPRKFKSENSR